MKKSLFIAELCSALLILLFGYTAISKATHLNTFRRALAESPATHMGAGIIAWLIISAEAMIVLLLFFRNTRKVGLYLSFIFLCIFTLYLGYMVMFVNKLPCSCGGVISKMSWRQHIGFNIFFLLVNAVGIWKWRTVFAKQKTNEMS